jgi:hypothetical protein
MATKKGASTKSGSKKGSGKSGSGKRTLISTRGDDRYIRRDAKGQITESDDRGKSQAADMRVKAKKTVKPGYGDQGDQAVRKGGSKKSSGKKGAKKSSSKKS